MEKKTFWLGLALGIGCVSSIVLISTLFSRLTYLKMNTALQHQIETTIETSSIIDFSKVTDFNWDTLYVFTPYSSPNEILKANNIMTFNPSFNIEYSDTIVMLGFVRDHSLVTYVELPLNLVENLPATSMCFSKNTAVFKIIPEESDKKTFHTIAF
ncbi:hypothetical protein [Cellulosilyticum ruminicola]|uniref:hypothetical protein n=1 Tax=Cellulosilyticum ruminicola TaxID=425254 RepID=UPI0006D2991B|nr:hypothetical protein [Cellulosilyticum ruminicola]